MIVLNFLHNLSNILISILISSNGILLLYSTNVVNKYNNDYIHYSSYSISNSINFNNISKIPNLINVA